MSARTLSSESLDRLRRIIVLREVIDDLGLPSALRASALTILSSRTKGMPHLRSLNFPDDEHSRKRQRPR